MSALRGQEPPEFSNDPVHKIREILERFERRFRINDTRSIQRYIEGEASLLCHFHVDGFDEEFVAYMQGHSPRFFQEERRDDNLPRVVWPAAEVSVHRRELLGSKDGDIKPSSECGCTDEELMLVGIVQRVQLPQCVALPAFVRLGCIDCVYNLLPNMLCYSASRGWVMRGKVSDGVVDLLRLRTAVRNDQLVGDLIERASEILDYVGGNRCQCIGHVIDFRYVVDTLSSLRIFFDGDSIWTTTVKGSEGKLKVLDVLFGPCDFRPYAVNGAHR